MEVGGHGVVSLAGSAVLRLIADNSGLTGAISTALWRRVFTPVHDRGRGLVDTAVCIADGGRVLSDLATCATNSATGPQTCGSSAAATPLVRCATVRPGGNGRLALPHPVSAASGTRRTAGPGPVSGGSSVNRMPRLFGMRRRRCLPTSGLLADRAGPGRSSCRHPLTRETVGQASRAARRVHGRTPTTWAGSWRPCCRAAARQACCTPTTTSGAASPRTSTRRTSAGRRRSCGPGRPEQPPGRPDRAGRGAAAVHHQPRLHRGDGDQLRTRPPVPLAEVIRLSEEREEAAPGARPPGRRSLAAVRLRRRRRPAQPRLPAGQADGLPLQCQLARREVHP